MAVGKRGAKAKHQTTNQTGEGEGSSTKRRKDNNLVRRKKYRDDPSYREAAKKRSRDTYRKAQKPNKGKGKKVAKVQSKNKEVYAKGMEHPMFAEVFTIPETAKKLGKNVITLKRWIAEKILPPPILECTTYNYKHYSLKEVQIMDEVLKQHAREYEYLHITHDFTINQMWQRIEAHRKSNI